MIGGSHGELDRTVRSDLVQTVATDRSALGSDKMRSVKVKSDEV